MFRSVFRLSVLAAACLCLPSHGAAQSWADGQGQQAAVPPTQFEQMNDPQPLTRIGPNGEPLLVARGRSVIIRPGLRGLYITQEGQPRVVATTRQEFTLERGYNSMRIRPLNREEQIMLPARDVIPDGQAGKGQSTIAEAWLIQPTDRYDHGVLGDDIEAGALRVVTRDNRFAIHRLTDGSVFEGTKPLVGDVDGDGRDEVLVVNSNHQGGSALHIYRVMDQPDGRISLQLMAEGPRLGRKHRWLNPVGIGDFNLDGQPEIAVVETPHLDGTLKVYRMVNGRLREVVRATGFSNHALGSAQTGMHLIRDLTGDNRPDLVIPDTDRERLRIMTMTGDQLHEVGLLLLPSKAMTDILWIDEALTLGIEDNSVLSLSVFIQ